MYFHFLILRTFGFIDDLITINNKWWWWWMMIMNWFCGMPDRQKTFSLIYSLEHRQRSSPSRICDTLRVGFEAAKNLNSGLAGWSCAVVKIEHFQKNIQYIYPAILEKIHFKKWNQINKKCSFCRFKYQYTKF